MAVAVFILGLLLASAIVVILATVASHTVDWDEFNFGGTDDD